MVFEDIPFELRHAMIKFATAGNEEPSARLSLLPAAANSFTTYLERTAVEGVAYNRRVDETFKIWPHG